MLSLLVGVGRRRSCSSTDVHAAGAAAHPGRSLWLGALLGAVGLRGPQAAASYLLLGSTAGAAGLPAVRDRADPARLDQLLLADHAVRRCLGARPTRRTSDRSVTVPQGGAQVGVELGDHVERDLLGAGRGALADVGAAAEALVVVLGDHVDHAGVALGLALRQHRRGG